MKSTQPSANRQPFPRRSPGLSTPEYALWRPAHPFLRLVSAFLSVVLAFTFGGPGWQAWGQAVTAGTLYVGADDQVFRLDASDGRIPLSSGTYVVKAGTYFIAGSGTVEELPETTYIRTGTYLSTGTFLSAGTYFVTPGTYVDSTSGKTVSGTLYLSSGTSLTAAKRASLPIRIAPDPNLPELVVSLLTLGSGTRNAVAGGLFFVDPVFAAAVDKKGPDDRDPISAFEAALVTVDPLQVGTLTLSNSATTLAESTTLSVPFGIKLSFNKLDDSGGLLGGAKILLGGTGTYQTWTIGDRDSAAPSALAGYYDYEASRAVRVENPGKTVKTLRIVTYTRDGGPAAPLSSAYLDVGPFINLSKSGSQGVLSLRRENPAAGLFSGTIDISGGEVELGDGFLQTSGDKGPTVRFTALSYDGDGNVQFIADQYPMLRVNGTNVVGTIIEKLDSAKNPDDPSQNYVPTITGPKSGAFSGGTLVLELGTTNLSLVSQVRDEDNAVPLSLVKRGAGTFTPLNNMNSFSGGLTIEAGTVAVRVSGDQDAMRRPVGVVGGGPLIFSGSAAGATLQVGSEEVQAVNLLNEIVFKGSSDLRKTSKASIRGFSAGDSLTLAGNVIFEGEAPNDLTRIELNLTTPLMLTNTLSVAGTLTLTGGSTLTLSPEMASNILGDFVLQDGTLVIGANATEAGIAINGTTGNRRIVVTGTGANIIAGTSTVLPVWESSFSFSGADGTLEMQPLSNAAVAIRNTVTMTLEDGTLALGTVQKAAGASTAVLSKKGAGTLEFKGNILSTGALALTRLEFLGGPVLFSGVSPVSFAAPVTLSGSTLQISAGGSLSISGALSGLGFTKTGAGALNLTGANSISGPTILRSGPLILAAAPGALFLGDSQTAVADAPTLFSAGSVSGAITVGSGATSAYTATLAASGTSGTATFGGSVTLSPGPASLVLQAETGATLDLTGAWNTNSKPVTVGTPGKAGTVRVSKPLSTTGGVSVVSGSLQVGVLNALGSTTPITLNGGALALSAFNTTAGSVTLTAGSILGTGSLSAANVTVASGSIFATLAGPGSLEKKESGTVLIPGKSLYTGATKVSAGTLSSGLPVNSPNILVGGSATYKLTLAESATYNGSLFNEGTTLLTSTTPVVLTLGTGARLKGSLQIGNNVTLMPAAGAQDGIFATGFTLTLNGGSYSANGTTQTISNVSFLSNGGSLLGTGSIKTNTVPTASAGSISISKGLTFPVSRKTNQPAGGALVGTLEFYAGALGDLASGGSYAQIVVASDTDGATLAFDRPVTAASSVSARLSAGSVSSAGYTLGVGSLVVTPLFEIGRGVTALFTSGGSLSGGVLHIGGTVNLSATTKAFTSIQLQDGVLTNGTLSAGILVDQGTGAASLSTSLGANFGDVTKTGTGTLTIAGASPEYTGTLSLASGTVVLGHASALGVNGRVAFSGQGAATLRLAGNHLTAASLTGAGVVENAATTAVILTLKPGASVTFDGVLRDGGVPGSGALSVVKDGAASVTLTAAAEYTGTTTLKQGRLELSGSGALPPVTTLAVEGGILALGGNNQTVAAFTQTNGLVESGILTLQTGSFALAGGSVGATLAGAAGATFAGNVTLHNAATYTGATSIRSGKLTLTANGLLPAGTALTLQAGTFHLGGNTQAVASFSQTGGVVETGTLTQPSGFFALNGGAVGATLAGAAGATFAGNVLLSSAATYTGATSIQSGKLTLAATGLLPTDTALALQAGTFHLGGNTQAVASFTQTGGVVESGVLTQPSGFFALNGGSIGVTLAGAAGATFAGNVTLNTAATYTGATDIQSGRLQLRPSGALPASTALTLAAGTLALGGNNQTIQSFSQTGGVVESGTLTLASGFFVLNGGSVSATLSGAAGATIAGDVILHSAATYIGATSLASGRLKLASNGLLPVGTDVLIQNGTLDLGGKTQTVAAYTQTGGSVESGTVKLQSGAFVLNGGVVSAALAGGNASVGATIAGSVTLSGANTYTGVTTLGGSALLTVGASNALAQTTVQYNAGTVRFGHSVSAATLGGLTGSKDLALTNLGGGSVALTVVQAVDATYAGNLTGVGSFTKAGAGNLTLGQTPTYSGALTVSAGSLTLGTADLLIGNRSGTNNGTINLTLSAGLTNSGTYSGTLGGNGTLNLTSDTPFTLRLDSGARLGGTIVLHNVTLDLSAADKLLAGGTTLRIGSGAAVKLGATTQEIANLIIPTQSNPADQGRLLGGLGATVIYNSIVPNDLLNLNGSRPATDLYADTAIAFEVLSKTEKLYAGATQDGLLVTAGTAGSGANRLQRLVLQPESNTARVIIDQPLALGKSIEVVVGTATGVTRGLVSIENTLTLTAGSIRFAAGIEATLTQNGSLDAPALDNRGLLILDVSAVKTVAIPIRSSGSLQKEGAGIVTLTGGNSYTGSTILAAGTLELGTASAFGTSGPVRFAGGTLRYRPGVTLDLSPRIAAIASGTVAGIDTDTNTVTYATGLSGAGGIAKRGAGTLVLAGSNPFTGPALVQFGTLQVGAGSTTGGLAAPARIDNGAFLRFQRSNDVTYSGALTGGGTLEQAGTGLLKLDGGNSGFAGFLMLSGGSVGLGVADASGSASIVFNGGTLRYESGVTADVSSRLAALASGRTANVDTGGNVVGFASGLTGAGGLNKLGAGTLELQSSNPFTGPTNVLAGLLRAGTALASTSAIRVSSGGSLEISAYHPAAILTVDSKGTAIVPVDGGAFDFGTISNAGRLSFTGVVSEVIVSNLTGNGETTFAADATLPGGISGGSITVAGDLVTGRISAGAVSAAAVYQLENNELTGVDVTGGRLVVGFGTQALLEDNPELATISGGSLGTVSGGSVVAFRPVTVSNLLGGTLDARHGAKLALVSGGTARLGGGEVTIGTVSGGVLSLEADQTSIAILNGGTLFNDGTLTVQGGSTGGEIRGGGSLTKTGSLDLSLSGPTRYEGSTVVKEGSLLVGGSATLYHSRELTVEAGARAVFTTTGTISLGSLNGAGRVSFAGDALIRSGSITSGVVEVAGRLTANVSDGSVTAAALTAGGVSGGTVSLTRGASSIAFLTNGSINLADAATLAVSTGTFAGSLTGTGTLIKTGAAALDLTAAPSTQLGVDVRGGTLNAPSLLTGMRSVSVASGARIYTTATNDTFSGRLAGAGTTTLKAQTGTTLTLGATGFLQGGLVLEPGLTLDLAANSASVVDPATSFTLLGNSRLVLGARTIELQDLILSRDSRLVTNGAVILYDNEPRLDLGNGQRINILDQNNKLLTSNPEVANLNLSAITFEENSVGGKTDATGATYRFTAGRVKGVEAGIKRLLLDPADGKTVRLSTAMPAVSQEIVATGTGSVAYVSVGTAVATPRFVIASGIRATFTEAGSLADNGVFVNSGVLTFPVPAATKTVANVVSGSGALEKTGSGTLVLSGANTYSGATRLFEGVLQVNHATGLGTGTIVFNGGALKFGAGIAGDLSKRFAAIGAGVSAAVDTGTNNVTFASVLAGAGGLSKSGEGTLVLTAPNTFEGPLLVTAGTVKVGNGTTGALEASTADVASGALLSFARSDAALFAGALTGAGRIEQSGAGVLTLSGNGSAFTGTFDLRGGTTLLGDRDALSSGAVTFNGGTLRYGVPDATDLSGRFGELKTTALVDTGAFHITYQSGLTGTAGFTKYGTGSLTFAGLNTYTGATTVAAGTLRYAGQALAFGGKIHTLANTVVHLENNDATERAFNGLISGAGLLRKTGTGTVTIAGTQTNTGGVTLDAGSLILNNKATLGGTVTLNTGSTLDLVYGNLDPNTSLVFGGGKLRIGGTDLIVNSLSLGSGTLVFAGSANSSTTVYYSKKTGDEAGVVVPEQVTLLEYKKNEDGSPAVLSGTLKGTVTKLPPTSDLIVQNGGLPLTLAVEAEGGLNLTSFTGAAGLDLSITKPVNLSGDFRLKGGTLLLGTSLKSSGGSVVLGEVNGGTSSAVLATIGTGGSITARELILTGKSQLTLNQGGGIKDVQTLRVGALSAGVSDDVRRNDAMLVVAQGTLLLAPGQTLTGSGRIQGNVTLGQNAVLSPGNSPGTLHIAGNLNLTSGTVRIEVGRLPGGALIQDRISVTGGNVVIGGTSGQGPTFQIIDTDGSLSTGTVLGSLFVNGTASVAPTLVAGGTFKFIFARQSATGAVRPSVMYVLKTTDASGGAIVPEIQRLTFAETLAGAAPNVQAFAKALDTRILTQKAATDGLLELGTGITSLADLPAQLAAVLPAVYAEMASLSTQRTLNIHQGLVGHFSSLRANLRETPEGLYNVWTTGYGAANKQNGNRVLGTAGFSASNWGDLFGVEQRIGGFLLGVAGAAGQTSANFAQSPGSAKTDSWHGGLYGVVDTESCLVEFGVLYGSTDTRARRVISAPSLTTREGRVTLNGSEWVANFGLSQPIAATPSLTLVPSLRVIAQGYSQSAAKENALSGLEVALDKQKSTSFLHQAGMELRKKLSLAGRPAAASLQLDWIHNYSSRGRAFDMALSGNPAAFFAYRGSDAGADAFQVGAAFEIVLTGQTVLRFGGEYQSQTGLSITRGSVSLGYQF